MSKVFNSTGHKTLIPNIIKAEGFLLTDEEGKTYVDMESGVWCTSIGHNHPHVNNEIKRQLDHSISHVGFNYTSEILQDAAGKILGITDNPEGQCVFLCSGSEGIEYSRQAAKKITGNRLSMTLHDSYLGSYSSLTNRENDWYLFGWSACENCNKNDICDSECEKIKNIPKEVSEFIFEPGSSSGLVRFPPKGLIKTICDQVSKNGGKIVVNEVTTGIGRTGRWFGFQHYDVNPDFICIGKGVGNGYPVSIAVMTNKITEELKGTDFKYSQSHQNDPLGAVVAKSVIDVIEKENLIKMSEINGKNLLSELKPLERSELIKEVRGRGLMIAVEPVSGEVTEMLFKKLMDKGYLAGNRGSLLRIDPPLNTSAEELQRFSDLLNEIV
jgi:acetylornithine aminotransferase